MTEHPFCVIHEQVQHDINDIKKVQSDRLCKVHERELLILKEADGKLEKDNFEQWDAINELRKKVWPMSSIAAFIGSIAGALIVQFVIKHTCK